MSTLFGRNLKFLRAKEKLSQEAFALKIGLNRGNIASYEKGTAEPNVSNVLKIVKYFNIDLSDIVEKDLTESNDFAEELAGTPENGLFDVDAPEQHMIDELEDHSQKMEKFFSQSNDMQKIVEGFKSFYIYKKSKGQVELQKMVTDYEDLLELMESLLSTHNELIDFLKARKS